jgi:hypothetical protein
MNRSRAAAAVLLSGETTVIPDDVASHEYTLPRRRLTLITKYSLEPLSARCKLNSINYSPAPAMHLVVGSRPLGSPANSISLEVVYEP